MKRQYYGPMAESIYEDELRQVPENSSAKEKLIFGGYIPSQNGACVLQRYLL
jgi:hypothetical protein